MGSSTPESAARTCPSSSSYARPFGTARKSSITSATDDPSSIARNGRVDRGRPRFDAAFQVVDVLEALTQDLLGHRLAARTMVAVECDWRVAIERHQEALAGSIERTRSGDARDRALAIGSHVEESELVAIEHGLRLGGGQLLDLGRLVGVRDLEASARTLDEI